MLRALRKGQGEKGTGILRELPGDDAAFEPGLESEVEFGRGGWRRD